MIDISRYQSHLEALSEKVKIHDFKKEKSTEASLDIIRKIGCYTL